jgi:hypothetical protein
MLRASVPLWFAVVLSVVTGWTESFLLPMIQDENVP